MKNNKLVATMAIAAIGMAGLALFGSNGEPVKANQPDASLKIGKVPKQKRTEADVTSQKTEVVNGEEMTTFEFKDGSGAVLQGADQTVDSLNKMIDGTAENNDVVIKEMK